MSSNVGYFFICFSRFHSTFQIDLSIKQNFSPAVQLLFAIMMFEIKIKFTPIAIAITKAQARTSLKLFNNPGRYTKYSAAGCCMPVPVGFKYSTIYSTHYLIKNSNHKKIYHVFEECVKIAMRRKQFMGFCSEVRRVVFCVCVKCRPAAHL